MMIIPTTLMYMLYCAVGAMVLLVLCTVLHFTFYTIGRSFYRGKIQAVEDWMKTQDSSKEK